MRQLYPMLWLGALGLGAVILLRPGGLGTLLALAAQWENVPWSDNDTPPLVRPPTNSPRSETPISPRATSRPAAWPRAARAEGEFGSEFQRDDDIPADAPRANPLRTEPRPADDDRTTDLHPIDPRRSTWPAAAPPMQSDAMSSAAETYPDTGAAANDNCFGVDRKPCNTASTLGVPSDADRDPRDVAPWRAAESRVQKNVSAFAQNWPFPRSNPTDVPTGVPAAVPRVPAVEPSVSESEAVPCEGAEILGRAGSEVILAKEVSWGIAQLRAQNREVPAELLEAKIREILKQRVAQKIDERLIIQDAQRTIPKDNFPRIRENVAREFEASQIPRLMKATGARTRQELETLLEASGSSIEMQKRNFVDGVLANEWLRNQVKVDEEVSHEEMLDYYRQHVSEFERPARARWEQLTVRVSRFPSREAAYAALAQMGNQVLDGVPFSEVAKAQSHGSTAQQGGLWEWTSQGSLASELLDRAIFGDGTRPGIPAGALSPILEEEHALHIIRVIEREPPRRTPFEQAQVEIKKKIRARREAKAKEDYLARLRQQTPVWTAFDASSTPSGARGWLR